VESQGLTWHQHGEYWNEGSYYELTATEVDVVEAATNELHARCLEAVQHVIDNRLYSKLGYDDEVAKLVEWTWEKEPPSLYGRFDFAWDGSGAPKMLEYNADTPTSLVEAAVVQWKWLEDLFPDADQFNSLHESLIELWKEFTPYLANPRVHFASMDDIEDGTTVTYLLDTARQAGLDGLILPISEIGWDNEAREFVDAAEYGVATCFKLYPWENMADEDFFPFAYEARERTTWIEPAWKMILSNKAILPILWELFPDHPNLLPAFRDKPRFGMREYVSKPFWGREGWGTVVQAGARTEGSFDGSQPVVYQQFHDAVVGGYRPTLGSWMVGQEAHGMGIRETQGLIAGNTSKFVPHLFR
jgi:glutathionylspermidine synthase